MQNVNIFGPKWSKNLVKNNEKETLLLSNRLLEATKNETVMKSQDLFTVVRYVSYNPLGRTMAWDWTTSNWDYLVNRSVGLDNNKLRFLPIFIQFTCFSLQRTKISKLRLVCYFKGVQWIFHEKLKYFKNVQSPDVQLFL